MNKSLNILISILGLIVFAVLLLAIYISSSAITNIAIPQEATPTLPLLPSIAISAGVLIAILSFLRERKRIELEREKHLSEVMLSSAREGFHNVVNLLSDKNNDRVTWIRATRTLLKSIELQDLIKSPEYILAYQLEAEKTRNELYSILSFENSDGEPQPLPPQFFYGINDWATCETLDEAAIKSTKMGEAYLVIIDQVPPQAKLKKLSTPSVVAIYDFMEFPKDYKDPLKKIELWGKDWDNSFFNDQGAKRYVAHTQMYYAVDGKLFEINKKSVKEVSPRNGTTSCPPGKA